jgi:hypothetical protein
VPDLLFSPDRFSRLGDARHTRTASPQAITAHIRTQVSAGSMRTIALLFSLIVLAAPAHAAQRTLLEKKCHELIGSEEREGGRSHVGQMQVQRFSDCMMGLPR